MFVLLLIIVNILHNSSGSGQSRSAIGSMLRWAGFGQHCDVSTGWGKHLCLFFVCDVLNPELSALSAWAHSPCKGIFNVWLNGISANKNLTKSTFPGYFLTSARCNSCYRTCWTLQNWDPELHCLTSFHSTDPVLVENTLVVLFVANFLCSF